MSDLLPKSRNAWNNKVRVVDEWNVGCRTKNGSVYGRYFSPLALNPFRREDMWISKLLTGWPKW
jgi:hypothetical protein